MRLHPLHRSHFTALFSALMGTAACSQGPGDGTTPMGTGSALAPGSAGAPGTTVPGVTTSTPTAPPAGPPSQPSAGAGPTANPPDAPAGGAGGAPPNTDVPPSAGSSGMAGSNPGTTSDATGDSTGGTGTETTEPPPDDLPSLIGAVEFSPPSSTFQGELTVELSAEAGAEIRYSTDGQLPTADSPIYDPAAGLVLTDTAQVRAQAYVDGNPSGLPSTAMYVARTFDYESDIPIVILEGYAGGRPQKEVAGFGGGNTGSTEQQPYFDAAFLVFEPEAGVAKISELPTLATRAGYRERGQSSASFEKSPYRVEFWDNNNEDADLPLLGMPPEADWTMIGPYMDKTLIRNALVYSWGVDLGLETMDLRFAEVFINFDGGPVEESDYFGVYAITEKIKNQKHRVDLKQLDASMTTMPEISGGYMIKFDQAALDGEEVEIVCTGSELFQATGGGFFGGGGGMMGGGGAAPPDETEAGHCFQYLGIIDPEPPNSEQVDYITTYIQEFHDTLHQTPMGDIAQYIDLTSFIDHMLINELTMDVDAYVRSSYLHKDRDELLKMGPLWDYNFSLGSVGDDVEEWRWQTQATSRGTVDWYQVLAEDPQFMSQLATRWRELRQGVFSLEQINARIDEISAPLVNAAARDLERWPVGESGGFFGGGGGGDAEQPQTWEGQLDAMRDWIARRLDWIDANLAEY